MANPEHLAKLKEGVEAWNKWRAENEGVRVDLSKAYLNGAKLTKADLDKKTEGVERKPSRVLRETRTLTYLAGRCIFKGDTS